MNRMSALLSAALLVLIAGCAGPGKKHPLEAGDTTVAPPEAAYVSIPANHRFNIIVTQTYNTLANEPLRRDVEITSPDPHFKTISFNNTLGDQTLEWPKHWIEATSDLARKAEYGAQAAQGTGSSPMRIDVKVKTGNINVPTNDSYFRISPGTDRPSWIIRAGRDGVPGPGEWNNCVITILY